MKLRTLLIIDALLILANLLCILTLPGSNVPNWIAIIFISGLMYFEVKRRNKLKT